MVMPAKHLPLVIFAARRLYYTGEVKQSDIAAVFDLRRHSASRRMGVIRPYFKAYIDPDRDWKMACMHFDQLRRDYPAVEGNRILDELRTWNPNDYAKLGYPVEDALNATKVWSVSHGYLAPTVFDHQTSATFPRDVDFTPVLKALCRQEGVEIRYIKMTENAEPMWRTVFPTMLRFLSDHAIISCYDLAGIQNYLRHGEAPPSKTFVLFRILEARPLHQSAQLRECSDGIRNLASGRELMKRYRVTLNPQYNEFQRLALARELGLDRNDLKWMDSAALFFFKARFCSGQPENSTGLIWPPVTDVEKV